MFSNAVALAFLTTAGCVIVYKKMPRKVRKFIEKYSLMTDLACLIAVYMLLGGTLTALMAGAMCGLLVSVMLHVANNEEDFLYLYDMRDFIKEKLSIAKEALNEYGKVYRKRRLEDDTVVDAEEDLSPVTA